MKKLILSVAVLGFTLTCLAQNYYWDPQQLVLATLNAGTASNVNKFIDCRGGKEVFIEASYNLGTNYAVNSTFPATDTNLVFTFRRAMAKTGPIGETSDNRALVPAAWTLKVLGCGTNTTFHAVTNFTVNGCPFLEWYWVTNACGVDANCKATNVTVKAYVK